MSGILPKSKLTQWTKWEVFLAQGKGKHICGGRKENGDSVAKEATDLERWELWDLWPCAKMSGLYPLEGLETGLLKALKYLLQFNGGWIEGWENRNDMGRGAWERRTGPWVLLSNLLFPLEKARNFRHQWWNRKLPTEVVCFSTDISNKNVKHSK